MYNFDFSFIRAGAPIITLSSTGLAFNQIVRRMLGYPAEIDIGYDEVANAIGICPHRGENGGKPYEFESREKDGWIRISCRDFMRYLAQKNKIDFSRSKQFIPQYDDNLEMLVVIVDEQHMKPTRQPDPD